MWGIANSLKNIGLTLHWSGKHSEAMRHYSEALQITIGIQSRRETLEIINRIVYLIMSHVSLVKLKSDEAYMLFTFVWNHPATENSTKEFAASKRQEFAPLLSTQMIADAEKRARITTIESVVSDLLNHVQPQYFMSNPKLDSLYRVNSKMQISSISCMI